MAQEVIYRLVDDLTGEYIPEGTGESLVFAYDGSSYEIDLSAENAAQFHELLSRYANAGRKVPGNDPRLSAVKRGPDQERLAKIRAWAKKNGYKVNARGRVPKSIVNAYEAAR